MISGQPIGLIERATLRTLRGLNPFDIRATDRTPSKSRTTCLTRLNPFDIRATDRTDHQRRHCVPDGVLIPLISGQPIGHLAVVGFTTLICLNPFDFRATDRTPKRPTHTVRLGLNPFDIRATDRTDRHDGADVAPGLNPFDIRATDRTEPKQRVEVQLPVLIPLISGQPIGQQSSLNGMVGKKS